MEELLLNLQPREVTGKAVKQLRKDNMVPAVIHDHGKPSVIVMAPYLDLSKLYQKAGKRHPVIIVADGKRHTALIKQVDFDPKKHQLRHVVFNAVKANEKVTAEVPVRIKYADEHESTPAERAGLVVLHQLEEVEVEAVPAELPDALFFDAEKLVEAGQSVTVADLIVPKGVTLKTDPSHPVATVFEPSALQAANDAAGGDAEEEVPTEETAEGEEATNATEAESEPKAKKE
ncbi:MAG TPA: 50S ribosomal protein L25 [Candidatus Saccharimonadales bacterium]|nr:50S ribosomal protein L25 [Candidatus Saccharimonadales bacterium]